MFIEFQHTQELIDYFLPITLSFWAFCLIFMFCELGEQLATKFNEIGIDIYFWDWYTLPHEIQNILSIIIAGTQKPMTFSGFGSISCTRIAFKSVMPFTI